MSCTQVFDYDLVGPDVLIVAFDIALSSLEVTHESNAVWHPLYDAQNKLAGKLLLCHAFTHMVARIRSNA